MTNKRVLLSLSVAWAYNEVDSGSIRASCGAALMEGYEFPVEWDPRGR